MRKKSNLLNFFTDFEIGYCYLLHGGHCYPVTDFSTVKFSEYRLTRMAQPEISDWVVEINCDELVSYLLHLKSLPG